MISWPFLLDFLATCVALMPAGLCLLSGRALARMSEDAALAERLWTHRQRTLQLTVIAGVALAIALPRTLLWSLPLLIIGRALSSYRLRRALYGETWGLGRYLWGVARFYAAFIGFWVLLGFAPTVIQHQPWGIAAAVALALAAWNWWYGAVALYLLRAKPLLSAEFAPLFEAVVTRAHVARPLLWRAGPAGAVIANAVAFPSLRGSSVLFSETLLARLTGEELAAIFAHEVAHLEHYRRALLVRGHCAALALILLGTVVVPAATDLARTAYLPVTILWPIGVLSYLAIRMQKAQQHETASDLRAVELCGSARALADALVKLHAITRMPRRWELQLERSASHPSLARRLQAILGTTERQPEPGTGLVFLADEPGVAVAFDSDGVTEYRNVPAECAQTPEALAAAAGQISKTRFAQLAELRLAAAGSAAPQLVIVDRAGARRRIRMRREDSGRLQQMLDRVDALLPPPPKTLFAGRSAGSIAASLAAIFAVSAGQVWSVVLLTLLAAFRPSAPMLLNAATGSLLAALLILGGRTGASCWRDAAVLLMGALPLSAVALRLGWRLRKSGEGFGPQEPAWVLWTLGLAAAVAMAAPAVLAQGSLLLFTETATTVVGATLLPFAAGLLLVQDRRRSLRILGLFSLLAAALPPVAGTPWFRDRVVRDRLLSAVSRIPESGARMQEVAVFPVECGATDLRVSPLGTSIATRRGATDDEDSDLSPFTLHRRGENSRTIDALDLQFIDEASALVLVPRSDPAAVRVVQVVDSGPLWEVKLEKLHWGRIAVSRAAARWRVVGETTDRTLVRYEGALQGGDEPVRTAWRIPPTTTPWSMRGIAGSGGSALWVQQEWQTPTLGRFSTLLAALAGQYRVRSRLYLTDAAGSRLLADSDASLSCVDAHPGENEPVCFATHRNVTNVFAVDPGSGSLRDIGRIDGPVWAEPNSDAGPVRMIRNGTPALLWTGNTPRLLRVASAEPEASFPATAGSDVAGRIVTTPDGCTVRVFRINPE